MTFSVIRDEIVTLLESVTGIGKVHDFKRLTKFWDDYFDRHKSGGTVPRISLA